MDNINEYIEEIFSGMIMSSEREKIQSRLEELLYEGSFTAPYGILSGKSEDNKYRTVAFGIARYLDAEIRIYGPKFLLLRWNGRTERFYSETSLVNFIKSEWSSCFND